MSKDLGKPTLALLKATYDIVERDVGLGLITEQDMRFTIEARKETAKRLAANGMSQRQIAKATGVSKTQVIRDLDLNGPKDGPKGTAPDREEYQSPPIVNHLIRRAGEFTQDFVARFRQWLGTVNNVPEDAKTELIRSLSVCVDQLQELIGELDG